MPKKAPENDKNIKPSSDRTLEKDTSEAPEMGNNAKIAELTADLQRTRADFENFRKNVEKDRLNAKKIAEFATVNKFLPLIDDIDRAIVIYPELKPLEKNLEKLLKNLELEKISSKPGAEFNPELHEAVMTEGEGETETIAETLRSGYRYQGEVLRPAMVKIALV